MKTTKQIKVMQMNAFLKTDKKGPVLQITIDRPKANALDARSCREWVGYLPNFAMIQASGWLYYPSQDNNFSALAGI